MRPIDTSREDVLSFSSDLALRRRFMVVNEPIPGNLRFGRLLEVLDRVAADTALDHAHRALPDARVVTAAVDEIVVRHVPPVHPSNYAEDARYLRARRNLASLGARAGEGWIVRRLGARR